MRESHSFLIHFFTAHFKRHLTKKFRSSYILPPPTVIWGMIGACFGLEREEILDLARENNLVVGSELCDFKGLGTEKATLMKWKTGFIRAIEDFEFIIEPTFRIVIQAKSDFVVELKKRIEKRNFDFDIYGGITDCFLKDIENENGHNELEKRTRVRGMVPVNLVKSTHIISQGRIIQVQVLYLNTFFYQGFNIEFELIEPIKAINGIAVWEMDDVEKFRQAN